MKKNLLFVLLLLIFALPAQAQEYTYVNKQLNDELSSGWGDYADDEYTEGSPFSLTGDTTYEIPNNALSGPRGQEPSDVAAAGGFFIPSYVLCSSITGTFQVGETITGGTSSDTAVITSIDTTNSRLYVESIDTSADNFQDAETITGGTSSATCTASGTRVPGKVTGRNGDGINVMIDLKLKPTTASTTMCDVWVDIGGSVGELYRRTISFPKGQNVEAGVNASFAGYTLDTWETNGRRAIYSLHSGCRHLRNSHCFNPNS